MISSREAATEDRVSGIISGIEDFDLAWPGSKWRCLKVVLHYKQWSITVES